MGECTLLTVTSSRFSSFPNVDGTPTVFRISVGGASDQITIGNKDAVTLEITSDARVADIDLLEGRDGSSIGNCQASLKMEDGSWATNASVMLVVRAPHDYNKVQGFLYLDYSRQHFEYDEY